MAMVENSLSRALSGARLPTSTDRVTIFRRTAWGVFVALVLIDAATALIHSLGPIGVLLWYLSYLFFFAFAAVAARDILRDLVANREPLLVIVILVYVAIVVANLTDPRSMSAEAAHEIDCTLRLLASTSDHAFRGTCLFGYPARQFLLPAIPSLLFGRSQLLLNLGGDIYFLLGVLIFGGGVIRYRRADAGAGLLAALLLTVFLHVYFWSHFILIYEQSIFPLSFALIGGGLLLYYLSGETAALPLGGLLLLYLIESYTPSLAVYSLAGVTIGYLAFRGNISRGAATALVAGSLIVLLVSFGFRADLNVGARDNPTLGSDIRNAFEHVIYLNHGVPVTSPVLVWPLVVGVGLCLSWQLGLEGFVIAGWVIAVYLIAVVSHGYSLNSLDFRLHRAMIIFPVLITLGAAAARRFTLSRARDALTVVVLVMLAAGLKFHLDYRNAQQPDPSLNFASWMQSHIHARGTVSHPVLMWWAPGSDLFLPAVRDIAAYMEPQFQQGVIDQSLLGQGCPAARVLTGVIVLQANGPCFNTLRSTVASTPTRFDGYYVDPGGRPLAVFERPT